MADLGFFCYAECGVYCDMSEKNITYRPSGICATSISVSIDEKGIVTGVEFVRGCDGNHKGLAVLCVGQPASEVKDKLAGITCGRRDTSCPDQLAKAIGKLLA